MPAAAQAVGEADLIYLSGGKPAHLRQALDGSDVGRALLAAHERGAVSQKPGFHNPRRVGIGERQLLATQRIDRRAVHR